VSCDDIRPQLTAYLDGELADDRGSVVRGHLRGCSACRDAARDEAAVRDGLRDLAPVDPPASLWSGVQARLAAAEVADAERPRWRRVLSQIGHAPESALRGLRWLVVPRSAGSRIALGTLVASTAVVLAYWRTHSEVPGSTVADEMLKIQNTVAVAIQRGAQAPQPTPTPTYDDVSEDLAADNARANARYQDAIEENEAYAQEARTHWAADRQQQFDAQVAKFRAEINAAKRGLARQHAQSEFVRYLRKAASGDPVAMVAGGIP
jgi:putative zinc finger protein